eukprot:9481543-Pyramimonas_sp.AAC.1
MRRQELLAYAMRRERGDACDTLLLRPSVEFSLQGHRAPEGCAKIGGGTGCETLLLRRSVGPPAGPRH